MKTFKRVFIFLSFLIAVIWFLKPQVGQMPNQVSSIYDENYKIKSRSPAGVDSVSARLNLVSQTSAESDEAQTSKLSIKDILNKGDYCAFIFETNRRLTDKEYDDIAEYVMGPPEKAENVGALEYTLEDFFTRGYGHGLAESLGVRGPTVVKFYNAILLADQLKPFRPKKPDFKRAHEMLLQLQAENPQNGIFAFHLASLKEKMGAGQSEIDEQLRLVLESADFNDYSLEVNQVALERSLNRPMDLFAAFYLRNDEPSANVNTLGLLKSYIKKYPDLATLGVEFGKKLMRDGVEMGDKVNEGIFWSARDYSVGNSLLWAAWSVQKPKHQLQSPWNINFLEINQKFVENRKDEVDMFDKVRNTSGYCPQEKLEGYFSRFREEFYKYRRRL